MLHAKWTSADLSGLHQWIDEQRLDEARSYLEIGTLCRHTGSTSSHAWHCCTFGVADSLTPGQPLRLAAPVNTLERSEDRIGRLSSLPLQSTKAHALHLGRLEFSQIGQDGRNHETGAVVKSCLAWSQQA